MIEKAYPFDQHLRMGVTGESGGSKSGKLTPPAVPCYYHIEIENSTQQNDEHCRSSICGKDEIRNARAEKKGKKEKDKEKMMLSID